MPTITITRTTTRTMSTEASQNASSQSIFSQNGFSQNPLLHLLHLATPALPVGAFSYSEGLETLVQQGNLTHQEALSHWLSAELQVGAIRLEAIALLQAYRCVRQGDQPGLRHWNEWLSAFRETEELREQSWQMGRALVRLLREILPATISDLDACGDRCNFAIAFAIAAAHWQIAEAEVVAGYLHSWATNLVNAGVKLIPLGQTQGQKVLIGLYPILDRATQEVLLQTADDLYSCSWGLAIASMNHETLYSRLFRS